MNKPFEPKLLTVLREGYTFPVFCKDLLAGVIVGIVALPLSIAFAIASGVKPEQGLITAVVAGLLISVFSGSRVQIGGPTGAFIVIIFGIVQQYGYDGLAVATVMAGGMLIVLGVAKLGDVIKFIPFPVTVGFTSGIALIIFTTQIKDFFGLTLPHNPEHFLDKWMVYASHLGSLDLHTLIIGYLTIGIVIFWRRVTDRIPGPLVAIVVTTILVQWSGWSVATIGSRFGHVPNTFPMPHMIHVDLDLLIKMSHPAMTIALLAGIESLLSAVVADGMTGRRHRSNMELIAQGIANVVSPLFGGIPATGAIARTATNIKNGGLTPVAGIVHALTVLLIFLFFGKWVAFIPMSTLAGILIIVAYNMSEWHLFVGLFRGPKSDIIVLLITFFLTILVDLTVGIEVGVILAAFLFMRRMVEVTQVKYLNESLSGEENVLDPNAIKPEDIPQGVEVFEINGPFFFGAADKFQTTIRQMKRRPKVLILRMRFVESIDATGLHALEDLLGTSQKDGVTVIFCGVHAHALKTLKEAGIITKLGEENFFWDIRKCMTYAKTLVASNGEILVNDKG
ncbi:MAG: sulfate permease [Candidatus Omnitrophica bacterium]|nr:sulfate permease [Candidatus Omnitrophota bacterium]